MNAVVVAVSSSLPDAKMRRRSSTHSSQQSERSSSSRKKKKDLCRCSHFIQVLLRTITTRAYFSFLVMKVTELTPLVAAHNKQRNVNEFGSYSEAKSSLIKGSFRTDQLSDIEDHSDSDDDEVPFAPNKASVPISKIYPVIGLWLSIAGILSIFCISILSWINKDYIQDNIIAKSAWSSQASPFSTIDPENLGFISFERPKESQPKAVFGRLLDSKLPLPTNSWYENFFLGEPTNQPENKVFQVPYILDTAGPLPGIRTHPCHVQANSRSVMMTYELWNGLTLGAVEDFEIQYKVRSQGRPEISKLAVELEWFATEISDDSLKAQMRAPIVRGAPYTSMMYLHASPRIHAQRDLKGPIVIDNGLGNKQLECGQRLGVYSDTPVEVTRELKFHLDQSDMTWLAFFSEPVMISCSRYSPVEDIISIPGTVPVNSAYVDFRVLSPMKRGMVRIAMANNCTSGQNFEYCGPEKKPRDQSAYESLLRNHAEVYPSAKSDIEFTFPIASQEEEELRMIFNWYPATLSGVATSSDDDTSVEDPISGRELPRIELLMFALPHHQERMRTTVGSSNRVMDAGCMPTIHGIACPALGGSWSLIEHLHRTSFHASVEPQTEMLEDLHKAIQKDLAWRMPRNYMIGAGDTYFSGKLLAKLARVLIIAEELGYSHSQPFNDALVHLRQGVEVWLNGSAESMFLYDRAWGGLIMCGCDYQWDGKEGHCGNKFPNCPALSDMGQNFGAGFYNDHHYHFGYHIMAAAVVSKFDKVWAKKFHQHVLLLVRDIANPSDEDEFFPTWRHKDWYLGFSWASGIVTIGGKAYPNGRNQESVSEAIAAYEAIAMLGDAFVSVFQGSADRDEMAMFETSMRIRDMGRLLMATEIRAARTYWHVRAANTPGVARIYPDVYEPKIVGMIWSMLAQEQTWFGNEVWKSYGIQLLPLTPAAQLRDDVPWVKEMLPVFSASCEANTMCMTEGWSILIYTSMATIGQWRDAWSHVRALNDSVFDSAGGNGHSLTNTLWYIATRPPVSDESL